MRKLAFLAALAGPLGLIAQSPPAPEQSPEPRFVHLAYERERFRYERDGRRDPFLPTPGLADAAALAAASPPTRLLGIIHHPEHPGLGVALMAGLDATARPRGMAAVRLRVGQANGGVRLVEILARRVVIETDGSDQPLRSEVPMAEAIRGRRPR